MLQYLLIPFQKIYNLVVLYPMRQLYIHGYWHGQKRSDICAGLTNYDSIFWDKQSQDCNVLLGRKVESLSAVFIYGIYFSLLTLAIYSMFTLCRSTMYMTIKKLINKFYS